MCGAPSRLSISTLVGHGGSTDMRIMSLSYCDVCGEPCEYINVPMRTHTNQAQPADGVCTPPTQQRVMVGYGHEDGHVHAHVQKGVNAMHICKHRLSID